jgi:hypothetical protein
MEFGRNANDISAVLSESYGGEALETSSVFEWHKRFKGARISKSQTKAMLITSFDIKG